jgi:hypothetical protein
MTNMIIGLDLLHRRHGYGRWLAIVEDPQLGLGPVIRGELLLRGVNDTAGPSKNGDARPGEGQFYCPLTTIFFGP